MLRRRMLPLFVLLIGLAATLAATLALARAEEGRQEARFNALANGVVAAVQARMLAQLTLLRGTAGFFSASHEVSRAEFTAFVGRLRLGRFYPGVLGIGYAAYAPGRAALERLAAASAAGEPPIRLWPDGAREFHSAVLLLEPDNRMNRAALGYDMTSEPTRRAAMMAAARAGVARMSGRVRLVQEIEPVKQPGFLIYLPIYDGPRGIEGRLRGWVYSPLRAYDLFNAIFAAEDMAGAGVEIYDETVSGDHLLYRSPSMPADPARTGLRRIDLAGRTWLVRVSAPAEPGRSGLLLAFTVAVGGTLISLLLAALLRQQVRAAARIERQVAERTAELSEANRRMLSEAEARERAEAQVQQMQKMEAIGQLTGGIAHDFNNMLAVVIGNLDLAERRLDDRERVARAIAGARAGAGKAADLTQRLLAFGRRQALAPRPIDPNALVAGMTELLRRTLGEAIRLETRLASTWAIRADPTQLESAILNIAINARDAMPEGGVLTIATQDCDAVPADAGGEAGSGPGQHVLIEIADTGTGMPEAVKARALEPFFTTKSVGRGTGLGLSQVYGFVRQSGGQFALDSREGEGTRVRLYLPRHAGAADTAEGRGDAGGELPTARPGEVVLAVEDEARVREMTVEALAELGYHVLAAGDGEAALALLADRPDIDLLFTDVVMPGMNGRELAARARALRPELRLLYTTGYAQEMLADSGDGPAPDVLPKPFSAAKLARRIRDALDRPA